MTRHGRGSLCALSLSSPSITGCASSSDERSPGPSLGETTNRGFICVVRTIVAKRKTPSPHLFASRSENQIISGEVQLPARRPHHSPSFAFRDRVRCAATVGHLRGLVFLRHEGVDAEREDEPPVESLLPCADLLAVRSDWRSLLAPSHSIASQHLSRRRCGARPTWWPAHREMFHFQNGRGNRRLGISMRSPRFRRRPSQPDRARTPRPPGTC
jgi:hypothetical protein